MGCGLEVHTTVPAHEFTYSDHRAAYVICMLVPSDTNRELAIGTVEILVKL
jgi:hypothetical protein